MVKGRGHSSLILLYMAFPPLNGLRVLLPTLEKRCVPERNIMVEGDLLRQIS